jgi:hypothetical protein
MVRMAFRQAPGRQPAAPDHTESFDRGTRVDAAARRESTGRRSQWRVIAVIRPEQTGKTAGGKADDSHRTPPTSRASARSRSAPRSLDARPADSGRARTTTRVPLGNAASRSAIKWRSCRVTRCRHTDEPTCLLTMNPARGSASPSRNRCTTSVGRPARAPPRTTSSNSTRRRSRAGSGSMTKTGSGRQRRAALVTPARDDRPSGAGPHAQPKTVGLRATAIVRLIGALAHGESPKQTRAACDRSYCPAGKRH